MSLDSLDTVCIGTNSGFVIPREGKNHIIKRKSKIISQTRVALSRGSLAVS